MREPIPIPESIQQREQSLFPESLQILEETIDLCLKNELFNKKEDKKLYLEDEYEKLEKELQKYEQKVRVYIRVLIQITQERATNEASYRVT